MTESFVEVAGLSAGYEKRVIVENVKFSVRRGEVVAVIGPNGAGKSTLLKTMAGVLPPICGDVMLYGASVSAMKPDERARHIATLFTDNRDAEYLSCRDVVEMGRYPYTGRLGVLSADDRAVVDDAMQRLLLEEISEARFDEISDGQRQRVLLARALSQEPEVLILDEPASYLDIKYQLELSDILRELSDSGISVIVSMHELSLVKSCASRVLCVYDGGAWFAPDVEELFSGERLYEIFGIDRGAIEL